jgi:MerR family redox-sensitive transcriptional activator SoxR
MSLLSVLSVGEVARRSGLAVSALHYYEREGLIQSWRSAGNQRRYDRAVLRRLAIVKAGQQVGISIAEIRTRLAGLPSGRTPTRADWGRLAAEWRDALDRRIATLERLRDRLDGCIGCGCLSIETCPLRNPADVAASAGPGAHYL